MVSQASERPPWGSLPPGARRGLQTAKKKGPNTTCNTFPLNVYDKPFPGWDSPAAPISVALSNLLNRPGVPMVLSVRSALGSLKHNGTISNRPIGRGTPSLRLSRTRWRRRGWQDNPRSSRGIPRGRMPCARRAKNSDPPPPQKEGPEDHGRGPARRRRRNTIWNCVRPRAEDGFGNLRNREIPFAETPRDTVLSALVGGVVGGSVSHAINKTSDAARAMCK